MSVPVGAAVKERANSFVTNVGDISEMLCSGVSDVLEVESCAGTSCDVLSVGKEFEHGRVGRCCSNLLWFSQESIVESRVQ